MVFSGLDDDSGPLGSSGYWTLDNVAYNTATVPVPAALPLMLLALGGLGVAARRRKAV